MRWGRRFRPLSVSGCFVVLTVVAPVGDSPEGVEPREWRGQLVYPSQSILLCTRNGPTPTVTDMLIQLARQGVNKPYDENEPLWGFVQQAGDSAIWRARAKIVTQWYRHLPDDVFLMIDDDVSFHPDAATKILKECRETRSIVCGAYATRGATHFAYQAFAGQQITFGPDQPLVKVRLPATGFMAVHRDVIDALTKTMQLCNVDFLSGGYWPLFCPFVSEVNEGTDEWEELSEDYAFGARARALGFKVWLDPSIYLEHEGTYRYSINDVVRKAQEGTALYSVPAAEDGLRELLGVGA